MPFRRRPVSPPDDATLVDEGAPPPPPPEARPPGPPEWWPWLLAFLILVLGGVAAAYVLGRDDDRSATTTATTETTSPRLSVPEATGTGETTTAPTTTAEDGRVAVPRVVGLRQASATERLEGAKLTAEAREVFADRAAGIVVRQRPRPDQEVDEGSSVLLEVSKGPEPVAVPNAVGVSESDAASRLDAAGFTVVVYDVPAADPKGIVVAQEPKAGEEAARGSRVRINVSTGEQQGEEAERKPPATVTVPDLVGMKRKQATDTIRKAGLKPDPKYVPSTQPAGTVVAQSPKPGATRKRGEGVRINVSKGPKPRPDATVPDVIGKDEPTATAEIEAAGLTVEVVQQEVTDPAQDGIVLDQSPGAGAPVPQGEAVTIVVGYLTPTG